MDAEYHSDIATTLLAGSDQPFASVDYVVAAGAKCIGLAIAFGALSIFGALGNCVTILAVVTNRHLRSQTSSYLIVNLAVANMMVFVIISSRQHLALLNPDVCRCWSACHPAHDGLRIQHGSYSRQ